MYSKAKFFLIGMVILILSGCQQDAPAPKPTVIVQPESYAVPPTVTAMNVELDGKKFYIENDKDGWVARPSSKLTWGWACVEHTVLYYKTNETDKFYNFHFVLPRFPVEDMTKVSASYNYRSFLEFVGKGNKTLQSPTVRDGYQIWFSFVDMAALDKSFSYRSEQGKQEAGMLKVSEVQELGNQQVVVTYQIDCPMYTDLGEPKGKLKGTIQLLFNFKQF